MLRTILISVFLAVAAVKAVPMQQSGLDVLPQVSKQGSSGSQQLSFQRPQVQPVGGGDSASQPSLQVQPGVIIHETGSSSRPAPAVQPSLQVEPGVIIHDAGSKSGPTPGGQPSLQVQPGVVIHDSGSSRPGALTLPAISPQPIPDDALPASIKTKRENEEYLETAAQTSDIQGRFFLPGLTWNIGNGAYRPVSSPWVKDGCCPATSPISSLLLSCRLQECEDDDNCSGRRKCCRYQCASICVDPVPSTSTSYGFTRDESLIDFEGSNYDKPGSCYRPNPYNNNNYYGGNGGSYYRNKRQVAYAGGPVAPAQPKYVGNGNGFGGQHGGNGGSWGNNEFQRCYRDRDCPGNKKCCDRLCRTPAYFG